MNKVVEFQSNLVISNIFLHANCYSQKFFWDILKTYKLRADKSRVHFKIWKNQNICYQKLILIWYSYTKVILWKICFVLASKIQFENIKILQNLINEVVLKVIKKSFEDVYLLTLTWLTTKFHKFYYINIFPVKRSGHSSGIS